MSAIPALLLAGGRSSRMGENKALLPFGSGRLVDHVLKRLKAQCAPVYLNAAEDIPFTSDIPSVRDDISGYAGPLAGVAAGLRRVRADLPDISHMLTAAVDTPFFPETLAEALSASIRSSDEIAVATDASGRWHPTFALWPVSLEEDLRSWLTDPENRKLRAFIERHPHRTVSFPLIERNGQSIEPFFNINTPEDYRRALSLLDEQA